MHIVLIAVISLDGRITRPDESGARFASHADQIWFKRALREFDACVMGRRSFSSTREHLLENLDMKRLRVVLTRAPDAYSSDSAPEKLEFTPEPPKRIVRDLSARGRSRCAVLGGGEIYRLFVDAGLVDSLWLTVEPVILGGGTPLIDGRTRETCFDLSELRHLSPNTLLLNYTRAGAAPLALPLP